MFSTIRDFNNTIDCGCILTAVINATCTMQKLMSRTPWQAIRSRSVAIGSRSDGWVEEVALLPIIAIISWKLAFGALIIAKIHSLRWRRPLPTMTFYSGGEIGHGTASEIVFSRRFLFSMRDCFQLTGEDRWFSTTTAATADRRRHRRDDYT